MANSTFKPYIRKGGAALAQKLFRGGLRYFPEQWFYWSQVCDFTLSPGNLGVQALDADTGQEVDLHVAYTDNLFPANVYVHGCALYTTTLVSDGVSTSLTAAVGDTGDPDGLLTATGIFTGDSTGWQETTAAAQFARRLETAFIPTLTLAAGGGTLSTITTGKIEIFIPFSPLPSPS